MITSFPKSGRTITIDTSIYSLECVLKAAYAATGKAFVHLQRSNAVTIELRIRPKKAADDPDVLEGEFMNDLLDQRLRLLVANETREMRDLILAHALSKTSLINSEFEEAELPRT